MTEKRKGLLADILIYAAAFGIALIPFTMVENMLMAAALMTVTATLVIYVTTALLSDVSIYDPYWSVAPPVMLLAVIIKYGLWNANAIALLALIGAWSMRLTANWYETYRGLGHEDWRYAMYRKKLPAPLFELLSFVGLQLMPTVVVYAGFVSALYAVREPVFRPLCALGACIMLAAILLEYVSDNAIHRFLRDHGEERRTCDISVWAYSRHPNYLGEMLFWTGLYAYFAVLCPAIWYRGLGFLSIIVLFLFVSIPMMEKHNAERRADYDEYKARTSVLLPFPRRQA